MRGRGIGTVAVVVALAAPGVAGATTYTVDPAAAPDGCSPADTICRNLAEAAAVVVNNDTVTLGAGTFSGPTATFNATGLTIQGPAQGGPTVTSTSGAGSPVVTFNGSATLRNLFVSHGGSAPAVAASGNGLTVTDVAIVNSAGPGLRLDGGANSLIRSIVLASGASDSGVEIASAAGSTSAKSLTTDSSVLRGGSSGAALTAQTDASLFGGSSGAITITARHLSTTGQSTGISVTEGPSGIGYTSGTVQATVTSSIVHEQSAAAGGATLGFSNSLAPTSPDVGVTGDGSDASDAQLFVGPPNDLHLRADATAAIDTGTFTDGESATDIDGQPRSVGTTDKGADEFVNQPPSIPAVNPGSATVPTGVAVTFTASSSDPEAGSGGGITKLRYDWGDGTFDEVPGGASSKAHAWATAGTYNVVVTAFDAQGATRSTADAPRVATVQDPPPPPPPPTGGFGGSGGSGIVNPPAGPTAGPGVPPTLSITSPRKDQEIVQKPRTPFTISGRAADDDGVLVVEIAVRRSAGRRGLTCLWWDGRRGFRRRACTRPLYLHAVVDDLRWRFRAPAGFRLPAGGYVVTARAGDALGNRTTAFSSRARTQIAFRLT